MDNEIDAKVGQALKRLRREKSMTVSNLASAAKVSAGMISRIENGQVSPSLTTLNALAQALNAQLMSLFAETCNTADVFFVGAGQGFASKRISRGHTHDYELLRKHFGSGGDFDAARVILRRSDAGPYRNTSTKALCSFSSFQDRPHTFVAAKDSK